MTEKRYSLQDVTEILKISMDTLYSLEDVIPELKPPQQTEKGERVYSEWDLRLVQQACKLLQVYHQDATEARRSLELWTSRNPRPLAGALSVEGDITEITSEMSQAPREVSQNSLYKDRRRDPHREQGTQQLQRTWGDRSDEPEAVIEDQVEVIEQSGGRQRRIGKVGGGDLFADFTDGFDLSPSHGPQHPQPPTPRQSPQREPEVSGASSEGERPETSNTSADIPRSTFSSAKIHQAPLEPASRHHDRSTPPQEHESKPPIASQTAPYLTPYSTSYSKPYVASLARAEQRSNHSTSDWLETQSSSPSHPPSSSTSHHSSIGPSSSDPEEQMDWRLAYHHSQAQLARVRGELARSQELTARQHHDIKLLQSQLLGIREQVLKEIYDLRDLVLDN